LLQHFHRDLAKKDLSDDALIDLMIQYPDLIQRPIVEKRERAILSRGGGNGQ
jgi:arsenate reductase-like glutaredoxin family protein